MGKVGLIVRGSEAALIRYSDCDTNTAGTGLLAKTRSPLPSITEL
jgi:hypothetical protein